MEAVLPSMLWQPESSWSRSDAAKVPRSLAMNKQPFRLGTGGAVV